jgi:GntR family transcriptional regulator
MASIPFSSQVERTAGVLDADIPIQVQIYRQLRAEILDGLWVGRDGFPGERELAERFGVSGITSRGALERLAREGLVERGRGRRNKSAFIPPERPARHAFNMFPPPEHSPVPLKHKLITHGVDIAPAEACVAFGLKPGARLWQAIRSISVGRTAQVITHHVQPLDIGQKHTVADLKNTHMVTMLRNEGIALATMRREIQATSASPVTAHQLGLSAGSPVLMVVLKLEDDKGKLVEWMRATARPDQPLAEETLDLATGLWHSTSDDAGLRRVPVSDRPEPAL